MPSGSRGPISFDINQNLAGFDADAYPEMLKEWEALIRATNIDYRAHFPQ